MFYILTSNFMKMEMQSLLQSCPMKMREPSLMLLKTWVNCALGYCLFDIFKVAFKSVFMKLTLAT